MEARRLVVLDEWSGKYMINNEHYAPLAYALTKKFEELRYVPVPSILFIENVGNLVCPASFDLGERHKVAVLSVTEGEDKPLKYPHMFAAASLMLLNKVDLLPYLNFDVDKCLAYAREVNPDIAILLVSATRGDGMAHWLNWLESERCA